MAASITVTDFSFRYERSERPALTAITFALPAGSSCAVLGITGSGKTTLLKSLSGILGNHHPKAESSGSIDIGGHRYVPLPSQVLFPLVGMVIDDPAIQISGIRDTVFEELLFTLENLGCIHPEVESRVEATLHMLNIAHLKNRHPLELSGGEQQRVALATILVASPTLLLLDEPTTSLDASGRGMFAKLLRNMRTDSTILLADHDLSVVLAAADYVLVLSEGRQTFFGSVREFLLSIGSFEPTLFSIQWRESLTTLLNRSRQGNRAAQRILRTITSP